MLSHTFVTVLIFVPIFIYSNSFVAFGWGKYSECSSAVKICHNNVIAKISDWTQGNINVNILPTSCYTC